MTDKVYYIYIGTYIHNSRAWCISQPKRCCHFYAIFTDYLAGWQTDAPRQYKKRLIFLQYPSQQKIHNTQTIITYARTQYEWNTVPFNSLGCTNTRLSLPICNAGYG